MSEVQTFVWKAAVAVGLPLGLSEDAGRAARSMVASGVGSFAAFVDAHGAIDKGRSTGFDTDRAIGGNFCQKPASRLLSAMRAGPSACDLIASAASAEIGLGRITLFGVDVPKDQKEVELERDRNRKKKEEAQAAQKNSHFAVHMNKSPKALLKYAINLN